jgi:hypothetical protein
MAAFVICVAGCAIFLLLAPLACSSQTVQDIINGAAPVGAVSLPSKTFSGTSNCNSHINASHSFSGVVSITGIDQTTTIDCSGTGLRCLSVVGVSVTIKRVKFIGNRAFFLQPTVPMSHASHAAYSYLATASHPPSQPPSDSKLSSHLDDKKFSSTLNSYNFQNQGASELPGMFRNRLSQLNFVSPSSKEHLRAAAASATSSRAFDSASRFAPIAGGCIFIYNSSSASILDSSFSNCASGAVGGSVAMILVITARISGSTFTDSLVNLLNTSEISDSVDEGILTQRIASLPGFENLGGGVGYGGSVFILPKFTFGVSITISNCNFLRSQVLATSDNYDFLDGNNGGFLLGGAFAAFLPMLNKSDVSNVSESGYSVVFERTSFTECQVLFATNRISALGYDVVMGGAIGIFDSPQPSPNISFFPAVSRVVLLDVQFSGTSDK